MSEIRQLLRLQYSGGMGGGDLFRRLGNVFLSLFTKAIIFGVYSFVYQHRLFTLGFVWWAWVLCFFADDLSYYWFTA